MGDDTPTSSAPVPTDPLSNSTVNNAIGFPPTDNPVVAPTTAPASDTPVDTTPTPAKDDDLLAIKQEALQHITPLIDHLDQTPEEKFRTIMMMIQSADNKSLIKSAYEAAKQITDDKVRAQALLDIVNEINYFTQQSNS
jgi:hypothetical protein